jgi:hypothetical protein
MTSAPLSLYLDLEPGQTADLEVVAKASLAFVAALKEIAFQIDPLLEIRVELDSGTKGSPSLNARLKSARERYLTREVTSRDLFAVTVTVSDGAAVSADARRAPSISRTETVNTRTVFPDMSRCLRPPLYTIAKRFARLTMTAGLANGAGLDGHGPLDRPGRFLDRNKSKLRQ